MKFSRTRALLTGAATALAALFLFVTFSSNTEVVRAEVDATFDENVNVQINAVGLFVSWVSAAEENGSVYFSANGGAVTQAIDDRGALLSGRLNKRTHLVTIDGQTAGASIAYHIESGGVLSATSTIQLPTGLLNAGADLVTGKVTYSDGSDGAQCLVHMRVSKETDGCKRYRAVVLPLEHQAHGVRRHIQH